MLKNHVQWLLLGLALLLSLTSCTQRESAESAIPLVCKDVSQVCASEQHQLRIQFSQPPQVMQPFQINVTAPEATRVIASFAMSDMEMGLNRYRLLQDANGTWSSSVTLPVCVQGRSDWTMLLEIDRPSGETRYLLKFSVD